MPDQTFNTLVINDKLGIGVSTDPGYQLHIASSAAPSQAFLESGGCQLKLSVDNTGGTFGTDNAFPLSIQTNNTARLSINSSGDIDIPGSTTMGGNLQARNATFTGLLAVQNMLTVNGNVGIGAPVSPDVRLDVNGTLRATTFRGNGAELSGVARLAGDNTLSGSLAVQNALTVSGNVGIGTNASSNNKLEVVGNTGIRQNKLYLSGNEGGSSLTYNAHRNAANTGWVFPDPSRTATTLEIDDHRGAARFEVYTTTTAAKTTWVQRLSIDGDSGNVGIGTSSPQGKLDVRGSLLLEAGTHPDLFTGTGASELNRYLNLLNSPDSRSASGLKAGGILVSDSYAYANPAKNDLIVKGRVGIGTNNPQTSLDVAGTIKGNGALAGIWAAQPVTSVAISANNTWQNVANTSLNFKLDRDAAVFFTYSINVQPDGNPGGDLVGVRLLIDNTPYRSSGSHFQPFTTRDSNVNVNGNLVLFLGAGDHSVILQWYKAGTTVASWSSNPGWADGFLGGRTLIAMAFYWPRPFIWVGPIGNIFAADAISRIDASQITLNN